MSPVLFEGTIFRLKKNVAYECGTPKSTSKQKRKTHDAWFGSILVTFSNLKRGFVYIVRPSFINWPLSRCYFGGWDTAF